MDGSYLIQSFTESQNSEIKRLKSQVELFFESEFLVYKALGFKEGMSLIECGSGPGYLIQNLALRMPNCNYSALEIDPFLFKVLQENASQGNKTLFRAIQNSIYETGEPSDSYDFAIARLVIEHLDKPDRAVNELIRILKPGGKLILISNDFDYHVLTYPPIPELHEMYLAYCRSRIDQGGNPYIGRQIPAIMEKYGFSDINMNVVAAHSRILGEQALLKSENVNISRSLVKDGYLKQETLDVLTNKWFEMLQHPDHVIYRQLFIISGKKTDSVVKNKGTKSDKYKTEELTLDKLRQINESNRSAFLSDYLISKVKESMNDDEIEISKNEKLDSYFIDSLIATDLSSLLISSFQVELKLSDILRNYSIADISEFVIQNLGIDLNKNIKSKSSWTEGEL